MKLLLAEDSALLRAGLEQLLSTLGHSVTAATDAEELRAIAEQEDFDLIITDVRMPPTMTDDGLRAVHDLRAANPHPAGGGAQPIRSGKLPRPALGARRIRIPA